ncbi:hypothetical protein Gohar_021801 [Gossypium harknessii]|uniref:Non-specific serine/threonine protein kinase n=1 Tax=Gossypium harknessii TaxID=34285 RepID=A0A7J9I989_9ROSI|nr:hypothetical protein [Gossypium harknessii]
MPSYSSGVGYGRLGPYLTFTVTGDSALEKMNIPWLILSLQIFIFFSLNRQLAFGADTISANQSLSGTQTIVSSGGHFVLGFFKPGNSSNYYIGMWYGKVNQQTAVWVANREIPVHDIHSSELKISNGNLVLFNESQVPIWSTNISSSSSNSVVAVLEDGGNLLSLNRRTNQSQLLTSWKNSEDPAPGLFSLELDPNGTNQSFILWNRSEQYWTSGAWDPQRRIFSLVPEMRLNEIYNYSYVSNENESYFTYSLYDPSTISRFVMDVSGQMKQLSWLESSQRWSLIWSEPRQQCEVYAFCGAFGSCNEKALPFCNCLTGFEPKSESDWNLSDFSKGCKRKTQLQCEDPTLAHGKSDKFLEMPNIKLPQHEQSMTVGSISECESTCLKNCSCNVEAILCWAFLEIYHCDIKPENILLDAEFCPKVADFGLAKLVGRDFSRVLTTMRGTRGYLAPEWISGVAITPKADVYSYGMMLFEIVSGRRNSQQCEDGKVRFIPTWAASLITEGGDVLSLLDPRLNGVAPVEEISRLCKVACWCIQDAETQRPSMGQVVQMLEGVLDLHLPPVPRSLQVLVDEQEHVLLLSESSSAESSQSRSYISTPSHAKSSTSSTTS